MAGETLLRNNCSTVLIVTQWQLFFFALIRSRRIITIWFEQCKIIVNNNSHVSPALHKLSVACGIRFLLAEEISFLVCSMVLYSGRRKGMERILYWSDQYARRRTEFFLRTCPFRGMEPDDLVKQIRLRWNHQRFGRRSMGNIFKNSNEILEIW